MMIMSPDANDGLTSISEIKEWFYNKRYPISDPVNEYIKLLSKSHEEDPNPDTNRLTLLKEIEQACHAYATHHEMDAKLVKKMVLMNYIERNMLQPLENKVKAIAVAQVHCPIIRSDFAEQIGNMYAVLEGKSVYDVHKDNLDISVISSLQQEFADYTVSQLLYRDAQDRLVKHYNSPKFEVTNDTIKWLSNLMSHLTPEQREMVNSHSLTHQAPQAPQIDNVDQSDS
jgi:type 1 glutamine amidotransferase